MAAGLKLFYLMQLDCAQNIFAFRPNQECAQGEQTVPKSGLYIDDVEIISLASMSQMGKHTYKNAQEALQSKTNLAVGEQVVLLQKEMLKHGYVMPQQQPVSRYGKYSNTTAAPSMQARGLTVCRLRNCSSLSVLYLQSLTYKGAASETVTIEIRAYHNGILGAVLNSYTVTAVADIPVTVVLDKHYSVDVAIVAQPAGAPYDTKEACACMCQTQTKGYKSYQYDTLKIEGWDGTEQADSTFGISICAASVCHLPTLICRVLPTLYTALYYRTAYLLLVELTSVSAPTDQTAGFINHEQATIAANRYHKMSSDARETAVLSMINNLHRQDNFCISCDNPASIKIVSRT